MIRVKGNSLIVKDNKYYFKDSLFTGISVFLSDYVVDKILEIKNGNIIGEFKDSFFPTAKKMNAVDYDCLTVSDDHSPDPDMMLDGVGYNGFAFVFDDDFCVTQDLYSDGRLEGTVGWYKDGTLELVDLEKNGLFQEYEWNQDGILVAQEIYQRNNFRLSFKCDDVGRLCSLTINGNYFAEFNDIKNKLLFPTYENKDFAKDIVASSRLFVSGDGVDDEIFLPLIGKGLKNVKELLLHRTNVSPGSVRALSNQYNLKKIIIDDDDNQKEMLEAMKSLKSENVNFFLEFNDEEV